MKNKLIDLHNHLFEQIERLNDESITGDSAAITRISRNIREGCGMMIPDIDFRPLGCLVVIGLIALVAGIPALFWWLIKHLTIGWAS